MGETSVDAQELARLGENLRAAELAFQKADHDEQIARHERTNALNRLNDHQKKLDTFIEKLKAASPSDGNWKQHARAMGKRPGSEFSDHG